ncbi:MAG: hypothetical protein ACE5HL_09980 [Terriglobia bacterium]
MSDDIRQAIEEYQANYNRTMPEDDLQPLTHRLLEQSGLQAVLSTRRIRPDIIWADPRAPIVGEIKKPSAPEKGEFNLPPQPAGQSKDGYIKDRNQSITKGGFLRHQLGDGLAQLHLSMREQHARYGLFTNGKTFLVCENAQRFCALCFTTAPVEKRCGFPQQAPMCQCDLLAKEAEKIEAVLEFLHKLWAESQKNW